MTPSTGYRRALVFLLLFAVTLAGGALPGDAAKLTKSRKETPYAVKGEIVDLGHYLTDRNLRGAEHADAARQGLADCDPPGLLSKTGDLYLLLGKNLKPANEQLSAYAGKQVKVTGKKVARGKMLAIIVEQVEELPAVKPKAKSGKASRN